MSWRSCTTAPEVEAIFLTTASLPAVKRPIILSGSSTCSVRTAVCVARGALEPPACGNKSANQSGTSFFSVFFSAGCTAETFLVLRLRLRDLPFFADLLRLRFLCFSDLACFSVLLFLGDLLLLLALLDLAGLLSPDFFERSDLELQLSDFRLRRFLSFFFRLLVLELLLLGLRLRLPGILRPTSARAQVKEKHSESILNTDLQHAHLLT
mmetsp:Transcript_7116/g.11519  ORF Transcript_7116/g.11519 Transcript_7116/m.11519 type:complete len:210 (-) Transcript_7116:2-631(-)